MSQKCNNCRFFHDKDRVCMRYPPTATAMVGKNSLTGAPEVRHMGFFPPVSGDHWCGEWDAAKTPLIPDKN